MHKNPLDFFVSQTQLLIEPTGYVFSKVTPRAAVAKVAASGKPAPKKDPGLIAMTYGNVYVASVVMGARDKHTLRAFLEAEA